MAVYNDKSGNSVNYTRGMKMHTIHYNADRQPAYGRRRTLSLLHVIKRENLENTTKNKK